MNDWRKELWHPLSVHFPIALLLIATISFVICFFIKIDRRKPFHIGVFGLLIVGSLSAWLSLYTGDLADGIVSRKICDPTILKNHQLSAQTMTYLFTSASVIFILFLFNFFKDLLNRILRYLILVLMFIGSGFLIKSAHLGASLVYQQGAGVYNHTGNCDEYE